MWSWWVPRPWCRLPCIWEGARAQPLLSLHTQLLDCDQDLYKNFPLVISERWQQEVVETIYDAVNAETDKMEARKKAKNKQLGQEEGKMLCGPMPFLEEESMAPWHPVLRGKSTPNLGLTWIGVTRWMGVPTEGGSAVCLSSGILPALELWELSPWRWSIPESGAGPGDSKSL